MMTTDDDLFTAEEVADQVGVETSTIYTWKRRGYIQPAGRRGKYRLYRLADAFAAEAQRKHEHRRKDPRPGRTEP